MEDLERKAKELAERLVSKESILPLLKIMANNMHLSYLNLLLVADQNMDASCVCGKRAWNHLGREIKPEAIPIQILFPHVQGEFSYQVVKVYDYASTTGQECMDKRFLRNPADRITELTGATWEVVPGASIGTSLDKGYYGKERNVFCISEGAAAEQNNQTILNLYVEYVMTQMGIGEKLVKMAVLYVIYEYFGIKNTIISALFGKLSRMVLDEKVAYLKQVKKLVRCVVEDLTFYSLSFNETAYLNELLQSSDVKEVCQTLQQIADSMENDEIKQELINLIEKLKRCTRQCFYDIYRKKMEMKLFSYPPVVLELDRINLLNVERSSYYGNE